MVDSEDTLLQILFTLGHPPFLHHIRWEFVSAAAIASLCEDSVLCPPTESLWLAVVDRLLYPPPSGFGSLVVVVEFPPLFEGEGENQHRLEFFQEIHAEVFQARWTNEHVASLDNSIARIESVTKGRQMEFTIEAETKAIAEQSKPASFRGDLCPRVIFLLNLSPIPRCYLFCLRVRVRERSAPPAGGPARVHVRAATSAVARRIVVHPSTLDRTAFMSLCDVSAIHGIWQHDCFCKIHLSRSACPWSCSRSGSS
jgi:hypothetical protein